MKEDIIRAAKDAIGQLKQRHQAQQDGCCVKDMTKYEQKKALAGAMRIIKKHNGDLFIMGCAGLREDVFGPHKTKKKAILAMKYVVFMNNKFRLGNDGYVEEY